MKLNFHRQESKEGDGIDSSFLNVGKSGDVDLNKEALRNLVIEVEEENVKLKEVLEKQDDAIKILEEELDRKELALTQTRTQYEELNNAFEIIKANFEKQTEELKKYTEEYKALVREMQLRKAKTNKMINDLEKSLLRHSKKMHKDFNIKDDDIDEE